MPAPRLSDAHFLVAAGVLTVILAGAAAFIQPADSIDIDSASSFSAAPSGGNAAYYTLQNLGYRVVRSYDPMASITADPSTTTLLITGTGRPSEQDRHALQTFLTRGGTVLLVGSQGSDFLSLEGAAPAAPLAEPVTYRALTPSPLADAVPEITMAPAIGAPKFGASYVAVFGDRDVPGVTTSRVGRGRVIWWAAPTPLTNAQIDKAANLRLLLNVAGPPGARAILWDEHYHGHSRSLWSYTARTPLRWIGAQLAVMLGFVFLTYSRRRGPVRARAVDARTSPLEFIDMLRALYQRAGAGAAAVTAARGRLTRTVTSASGLPADSSDEAVARAVASKAGVEPADVMTLLADTRVTADREMDAGEALKLTRRLQELTARLVATTSPLPPTLRS